MTTLPREVSDKLVFDAEAGLERLTEIMVRLRAPDGCPWDRVQDFRSIAPYTIEEACEVAEAIEQGDMAGLKDELGDLLLGWPGIALQSCRFHRMRSVARSGHRARQ